jgi:hypothetical protein
MFDNRLDFLLYYSLVQRPVQLPLYHFIIDIEEVILSVFRLELVFQALLRILKLLAEFLMCLSDLFRRSIDELIFPLDPGI